MALHLNFTIKEIYPQIYCITSDSQYDLCMLFFRWQEYYESLYHDVKGQNLDFFELMKKYTLNRKQHIFVS